jgi:hypothetical protein
LLCHVLVVDSKMFSWYRSLVHSREACDDVK